MNALRLELTIIGKDEDYLVKKVNELGDGLDSLKERDKIEDYILKWEMDGI